MFHGFVVSLEVGNTSEEIAFQSGDDSGINEEGVNVPKPSARITFSLKGKI